MMTIDANDLVLHVGHRLTVLLDSDSIEPFDGREDTHIVLLCETDDEIVLEETAYV